MPDWNLVHSFLLVAEHGSLSAAARQSGRSQPTLSRHIRELEEALAISLFDRTAQGLTLSPTGSDLADHARSMAGAADALLLAAHGRSETLAGTVRITASTNMARFTLPAILADLMREEPEIEVELVASDTSENLLLREADIAVRMYRPQQGDVITRHVGSVDVGAYASHLYLQRHGEPATIGELLERDLVGYDRQQMAINGFRRAGYTVDRSAFRFRCDDEDVQWQMVVNGFGIGFTPRHLGDRDPRVKRIFRDVELRRLPVWLTAHAELKTSRRVRRVYDFLADHLQRQLSGWQKKLPPAIQATGGR